MKWWPEECKTGDMIRVKIGSVYHFGIFVSEDEVIQFGLPPTDLRERAEAADVTVCATDIAAFACGNIVETAQFDRKEKKKRRSPEQTVAAARGRLGEGGYDILSNNCEHFANECVFGEKRSEQEEKVRTKWSRGRA